LKTGALTGSLFLQAARSNNRTVTAAQIEVLFMIVLFYRLMGLKLVEITVLRAKNYPAAAFDQPSA
jgi:hypothetical protein